MFLYFSRIFRGFGGFSGSFLGIVALSEHESSQLICHQYDGMKPMAWMKSRRKEAPDFDVLRKYQITDPLLPQTLFNPGCVPDSRYLALADNTLVCEASYSTFRSEEVVQALSTVNYDKSKLSVVIHSVPDSIVSNTAEFSQLIDHVRSSAYRAFVTDLSVDYYATFGSSWVDFVNLMAAKMSH